MAQCGIDIFTYLKALNISTTNDEDLGLHVRLRPLIFALLNIVQQLIPCRVVTAINQRQLYNNS